MSKVIIIFDVFVLCILPSWRWWMFLAKTCRRSWCI